jgi:hypothetical protein
VPTLGVNGVLKQLDPSEEFQGSSIEPQGKKYANWNQIQVVTPSQNDYEKAQITNAGHPRRF